MQKRQCLVGVRGMPSVILFSLLCNNVYNENNILVNIFTFFTFE